MLDQGTFGLRPDHIKRQSYLTEDVGIAYSTLVLPEDGTALRLDSKRINIEAIPYSDHFSEEERTKDLQEVERLKIKFKENEDEDIKNYGVREGQIFGHVLDALFYVAIRNTFPAEGAVEVTSEFDDYKRRTDFVINVGNNEKPLYLLVDTTTQTAPGDLREKLSAVSEKTSPYKALRQDVKYFTHQENGVQKFGLDQKPRVVVALGKEGIALLSKKFVNHQDFERVASYIFLIQVLEQLKRQMAFVKENMIKFMHSGVLLDEYREYIESIEPLVEEGKQFTQDDQEIKNLLSSLPIKDLLPGLFPIESDNRANSDEITAYRKAHIATTSEKPKIQENSVSMGGHNPILKLKKKNPPESMGDQVVNG